REVRQADTDAERGVGDAQSGREQGSSRERAAIEAITSHLALGLLAAPGLALLDDRVARPDRAVGVDQARVERAAGAPAEDVQALDALVELGDREHALVRGRGARDVEREAAAELDDAAGLGQPDLALGTDRLEHLLRAARAEAVDVGVRVQTPD